MVDATCASCGASFELEDSEVPPSGKVTRCRRCGKPITVMHASAAEMGFPAGNSAGALGAAELSAFGKPKRASPLAGATPPAVPRKTPATGLAAAGPESAPFGGAPRKIPDIPLPAPVRKSPGLGARGREIVVGDASELEIGDLAPLDVGAAREPASSSTSGGPDAELPVPVRPASPSLPRRHPGDLPAPVASRGVGADDLAGPMRSERPDSADLPVPVRSGRHESIDLPAPAARDRDLLRPKGFFDDVPDSAGFSLEDSIELGRSGQSDGSSELPAPKGFFDDIPGPSTAAKPEAPAPKGFFDDIPGPSTAAKPEAPAPKGFFDDIPAPSARDTPDIEAGSPGFFHDIPEPRRSAISGGDSGTLELDDLDLAAPTSNPSSAALDLGSSLGSNPGSSTKPLDLGAGGASIELSDLDLSEPADAGDAYDFGNVDLPSLPASGNVVSFDAPTARSSVPARPASRGKPLPSSTEGLELDTSADPPAKKATVADQPTASSDRGRRAKKASRSRTIAAVAALVLLGGGAGGYYMWQKRQAAQQTRNQVRSLVERARAKLQSDSWDAAASLAGRALRKDRANADALGIAAQAHYAAYLDTGRDSKRRMGLAATFLRKATGAGASGIEIDKAEALQGVASGRAPEIAAAIVLLNKVATQHRHDANVYLYLGWGHLAERRYDAAEKAFDASLRSRADRLSALYGLGQARARLGKKKEARDAFAKVIERNANHVGALVHNIELLDLPLIGDREARYVEILSRKDIDEADPRAVALAWSLAADQALRAGRVDEASQRYDRAIALHPTSLPAMVGKANAALRLGHVADARERLARTLERWPQHLGASLAMAEVELEEKKLAEAGRRLEAVAERASSTPDKLRVHMLRGQIAEATEDARSGSPKSYKAAIDSYQAARSLGGSNIVPAVLALARVYRKADRKREAIQVLADMGERARGDAALALTLGLSYLENDDPRAAETWFRRALELKPGEVEATFQLGLALHEQERYPAAVETIEKAYNADATREDIGVRLALILEERGDNERARKLYDKLLSAPNATVNVMARAGRFLVRMQRYDRIAELARQILKANRSHAAGLFLQGEALLQQSKPDDAVRSLAEAVKLDPDPQYLDGLGRAYEKLRPPAYDDAIAAYTRAASAAPSMLQPRLGMARIYLARNMLPKALVALEQAQRIDPKSSWIYLRMGMVYQARAEQGGDRRKRDLRAALEHYRLAVKHDSKNAEAHYRLGRVYYDSNRARDAARSLARATFLAQERSPQPSWLTEAYRMWGYAERSRDNRRGAITAFERYLARNPTDRDEAGEVRRLLIGLKSR